MSGSAKHPNIVFILADDMGCWAMGCAGNPEIRTPNLDRLAAGGLRFENFFCASPVCSPARASILTGRIPSQHGVHDWIAVGNYPRPAGGWNDDREIRYLDGRRGYTDVLAAGGCVCGLAGKWHLGDSLHPQNGFTYWHVFPWGAGPYFNNQMIFEGELRTEPGYLTDAITASGLRFIEQQARSGRPFHLGVHYTAPHSPWDKGQHPEDLAGLYADCPFASCPDLPQAHPWQIPSAPRGTGARRRELLSGYFAAISGIDRGVGQLLAALDRQGLRENTLVVFTSDNGMNMGHHGLWGKGNASFPLNMYDTSVKVPMLMAHPGRIPAGRRCDDLLSHYDLFPTLLDYAGLVHAEPDLPGRSFAPLLRGAHATASENLVVFDEYGPVRMIRTRDWKYVHRYPYGPHELFDLARDPNEECNLVADPAQADRVAGLRAGLHDWFLRYVDPDRDGAREAVCGRGQIERVGRAGGGRRAFSDWQMFYIDADGRKTGDIRLPGSPG
jgi:arylsulfatase A-like enzyme